MNSSKLGLCQSRIQHLKDLTTYALFTKLFYSILPLAICLPSWFGNESRKREPIIILVLLQISKRDYEEPS